MNKYRPALFFDRDGTIIVDTNNINNPDHIEFIPGAINALRELQKRGFVLIMLSNQSGIAKGLITQQQAADVHDKFIEYLKEENVTIDYTYYCPHKKEDNCSCRKPSPEQLLLAAIKFKIDVENSYMIGDRELDIETGKNAGCNTILINTRNLENIGEINPDFVSTDWNKILSYILRGIEFDTTKISRISLYQRQHDYKITDIKPLEKSSSYSTDIKSLARKIIRAKNQNKEIIFMMGAHVIKCGLQKYIIDLIKNGYITCIATNGACVIHDYEFSLIGATSENVGKYISEGRFGLWTETGYINDIINESFKKDKDGIGKSIGKEIFKQPYVNKDISIFANCYKFGIPITVHVGIGYDIIHEHPNFNGAATGEMSYIDFLKFTHVINNLEDGVIMSFGSATMGPEVFLKALSMARNIANQENRVIKHFTSAVFDLQDLPVDLNQLPEKNSYLNFFRPWKTILVRTVADGGESYYIKGRHEETIPSLWTAINDLK